MSSRLALLDPTYFLADGHHGEHGDMCPVSVEASSLR